MAGLLSKNVKLYYGAIPTSGDPTYTEVKNVQEFPDLLGVPENVDVTVLTDNEYHYIPGIKQLDTLTFTCLYDNSTATSNFRVLHELETAGAQMWKVEFPDGTAITFKGRCGVSIVGKGVNEALQFTLSIFVEENMTVTHPTP